MRVSSENNKQLTSSLSTSSDSQPFGIIAVFMDCDHTALTLHTYGNRRYEWETPWIQNIRAYQEQREFIDIIRQNAVFGAITFNENKKRIRGTYRALGFKRGQYYLHTELLDQRKAQFMGKNKHIAECLMQHYQNHDAPPIFKVIVMDDDKNNIESLKSFDRFVSRTKPYCNEPRLRMVQLIPVLVPKPEERCDIGFRADGRKTRKPILQTETVIIDGQEQEINFTQEAPWTRAAFIDTLHTVTKLVLTLSGKHPLPQHLKPKKTSKPIAPKDRHRLTSSFNQKPTYYERALKEEPVMLKCSL